MGKASSAKKVARAARAGGSAATEKRSIGFPLAIFLIMVAGVGLVVFARSERSNADVHPTLDDHWHYAYGVYACDAFLPPLADAIPDKSGIHTHGEGVVHIHPFSSAVTGRNATWSEFATAVGITEDGDTITLPDGTSYTNGDKCGDEEGEWVMARWPADDPDADPVIYTDNFGDRRFVEDRGVITLAFLPKGAEVPRPDSVPELDNLTDVGTQSTPDGSSTTVAGGETSTTTVAGGETSTTVAGGDSSTTTVAVDPAATTPPSSTTVP